MSYLAHCIKHKPVTDGLKNQLSSGAHYFKIKWRGVSGLIVVNPLGKVILYKRHSALGRLIAANNESEQHFIAKEVAKTPMDDSGIDWNKTYEFWSGL